MKHPAFPTTKLSCIIVEDEPLALDRAVDYVGKMPFLQLLATFDNALEAMAFLKANQVDLIFLDIHLGDLSGIQLLESVAIQSQVIFTTAYQQYALKGFDLQVTDYLLKPYTLERFVQAVDRAIKNANKKAKLPERRYFFVKTEHRLEKILIEEVQYIEGMGDYRCIHLPQKRILTLQTFSELEQAIPAGYICRVHKSYMVALDKIEAIERERIRIGDKIIPISETYKERFFEMVNNT